MTELDITILFAGVVAGAAPIVLAALGETITEKAGLINLSLDGSILLSAMAAFAIAFETGSVLAGFIGGALVGAAMALVVAVFSIYLDQNQVAVGFVLTLMGRDLAYVIGNPYSRIQGPQVAPLSLPMLDEIPFIGDVFFRHNLPVYLSLLLILLCWWYIYHTACGLELRSVGEHPRASKAAIVLYGLRRRAGGTGRCHVFTGHQARLGTTPGSRGDRLDCTGAGDLWRVESDKGGDRCLSFFVSAGYGHLFSGMAAFGTGPGLSGGAFSADDFYPADHVLCSERILGNLGGGQSQDSGAVEYVFRHGADRSG
jgi:hypothetical protein